MNTIIIGAGAAGLICAAKIKQACPGADVTIIEKADSAAKKLLASGNGRCNLSNISADEFSNYYNNSFAKKVIAQNSVQQSLTFWRQLGLITRSDDEGRIYPYSMQSATIKHILLTACSGVKLINDCTVNKVTHQNGLFTLSTAKGSFNCTNLIIACGSRSLYQSANGYSLAESLGHTVTQLTPSLTPLVSPSKHPRQLKGTRARCKMAIEVDGKIAEENSGEILFTDYGVSGICAMELSKTVAKARAADAQSKIIAVFDFVPDMSLEELKAHTARHTLSGVLPLKLAEIIALQAKGDTQAMAAIAKNWRLIISDTKGFKFSQVTSGGVSTSEIFEQSMMSRLVPNLYFIGEIVDVDGKCGGYNLQWAASSALTAAQSIINNKGLQLNG